jgi:hypothetical protein
MQVHVSWSEGKPVKNAGVAVWTGEGVCVFATNTFIDNKPNVIHGNSFVYDVELTLGDGRYYVMAGTFEDTKDKIVDFVVHGPEFSINPQKHETGEGLVRLNHKWK